MSQINILIAEDDKNLGAILKAYLDAKGCPTTLCLNGEEALKAFGHEKFNFCIFDVTMPGMDGFDLAVEVKKINKRIPLIFLTARSAQEDVLRGFEIGADDYITKPFSMDELLMRIKAVFRRSSLTEPLPTIFRLGSFTFDAPRHLLNRGDESRKLTTKEADLLLLLCEYKNKTLERQVALKRIWCEESFLNARSMDVYITKLRKYFKEDPNVQIANVHGVGFKLVVNN